MGYYDGRQESLHGQGNRWGPLISSMVKAVGEVVEENNKMLLENLAGDSEREASKL